MKLQPLIQNIPNIEIQNQLNEKYLNLVTQYQELKSEILFYNNYNAEIISLINSLNSKYNLTAVVYNNKLIVNHNKKRETISYYLPKSNKNLIKLLNSFLFVYTRYSDYLKIKKLIELLSIEMSN